MIFSSPKKKRFSVGSDTKADDQRCRHKVAQQKFVPQTNSKFLSLDLNLEEPLAEEEQFWDVVCPRERGFFFFEDLVIEEHT